jgi:hypothetical protein
MNNELKGQGEYRGDFTRDTHDPLRNFSRVLMQQGRVLLDADWNEQTSIVLHYLRNLAADLIGEHGGPEGHFEIVPITGQANFSISEGHYYVSGILCQNKKLTDANDTLVDPTYFNQPDYPRDKERDKLPTDNPLLIYLDVWERHVTCFQDGDADNPNIREVALGGPDTASRAQVVWQVKVKQDLKTYTSSKKSYAQFLSELENEQRPGQSRLRAQARKAEADEDACASVTSPDSRYRRTENQLYRVEIHSEAVRGPGEIPATFKWSRENGSVVFPILKVSGSDVTLGSLGRDERYGLKKGDWVEVVDDDTTLSGKAGALLKVDDVDRETLVVKLLGAPGISPEEPLKHHALLRRWDQPGSNKTGLTNGAILVSESNEDWIPLEDGVQIQFQPGGRYRVGDYWLIPARVDTGDLEWPGPVNHPEWLPAHGVQHYYAPLAIITYAPGVPADYKDCRRIIKPAAPVT